MMDLVGKRLGAYEITALIGEGGMGRVFSAHDSRLKRDVAIKILPEEFSRDSARLSRFQREAEALVFAQSFEHCGDLRSFKSRRDAVSRSGVGSRRNSR